MTYIGPTWLFLYSSITARLWVGLQILIAGIVCDKVLRTTPEDRSGSVVW